MGINTLFITGTDHTQKKKKLTGRFFWDGRKFEEPVSIMVGLKMKTR